MWFGLCAFGIVSGARKKFGLVMTLTAGEALSAFVLVQLPPWWHHYTLLTPFLATFAAIGVSDGVADCGRLLRKMKHGAGLGAPLDVRKSFAPPHSVRMRGLQSAGLVVLFLGALGLWLHDLPQLVRYNVAVLGERAHDPSLVVTFLKRHTHTGDYVISDNPIVVYLADCLLPPSAVNLPYQSTFRFSAESRERMVTSIERYPVQAIVVTGDYKRNPELMDWIETNFPLVDTAGGGGSNVIFGAVYTQGAEITHAAPVDPEQDGPPIAPDYIP